jgi:hypothetical protein
VQHYLWNYYGVFSPCYHRVLWHVKRHLLTGMYVSHPFLVLYLVHSEMTCINSGMIAHPMMVYGKYGFGVDIEMVFQLVHCYHQQWQYHQQMVQQ